MVVPAVPEGLGEAQGVGRYEAALGEVHVR